MKGLFNSPMHLVKHTLLLLMFLGHIIRLKVIAPVLIGRQLGKDIHIISFEVHMVGFGLYDF